MNCEVINHTVRTSSQMPFLNMGSLLDDYKRLAPLGNGTATLNYAYHPGTDQIVSRSWQIGEDTPFLSMRKEMIPVCSGERHHKCFSMSLPERKNDSITSECNPDHNKAR